MNETTIQARFEAFHYANPDVYAWLEYFTARAVKAGRERLGIRQVWERMRWELHIELADESSDYKLNDHYTSRYARLLEERHPEWSGLFETRRLRTA